MLIAAAVCPHPPILVPALAGAAAAELDPLRAACDQAIRLLLGTEDAVLIVVGGGNVTRRLPAATAGGLRQFGLDLVIGAGEPVLPLSLTIGRWLLDRAGYRHDAPGGADGARGPALAPFAEIASDAAPDECLRLGARLGGCADRVVLLVMGDGSACLSEAAPGHLDERAVPYDSGIVRALADADADRLAALDPGLSASLQVAGRAAWQVLAGAAGAGCTGELLCSTAPYGVGYHVATWARRPS